MTGSLSSELQHLVQEQLATGRYGSENELLLEAVRLLADRNRRRETLRRELQSGEISSTEARGSSWKATRLWRHSLSRSRRK